MEKVAETLFRNGSWHPYTRLNHAPAVAALWFPHSTSSTSDTLNCVSLSTDSTPQGRDVSTRATPPALPITLHAMKPGWGIDARLVQRRLGHNWHFLHE